MANHEVPDDLADIGQAYAFCGINAITQRPAGQEREAERVGNRIARSTRHRRDAARYLVGRYGVHRHDIIKRHCGIA
ncbi:Uncharacterised protein [Brucella melitensis]|nr:Uncharacterised protein [Brucella melitensis]